MIYFIFLLHTPLHYSTVGPYCRLHFMQLTYRTASRVPRPLSSPLFLYEAIRNGVKWPADGWGLVYKTIGQYGTAVCVGGDVVVVCITLEWQH